MSEAKKTPSALAPLSEAETQEAEENLVRCLDAYDRQGEAGLQEELNRIHPTSSEKRIPFMSSSFARVLPPGQRPKIRNAGASANKPNTNRK